MMNIELTEHRRIGQDKFDAFNIATYTNRRFGMFDGQEQIVRLRVKNEFARIMIDRFGIDIDIQKADAEWFEVNVKVAVSEQFLSWIISLGEKVVIVKPNDVIERMTQEFDRRPCTEV